MACAATYLMMFNRNMNERHILVSLGECLYCDLILDPEQYEDVQSGPHGKHTLNLDAGLVCESWSAEFQYGPTLPTMAVDFELDKFLKVIGHL